MYQVWRDQRYHVTTIVINLRQEAAPAECNLHQAEGGTFRRSDQLPRDIWNNESSSVSGCQAANK
jgi:hypothetical protein